MKILYIAVHSHEGWGSEFWLARAFERHACEVVRYDYRARRKWRFPWALIAHQLHTTVAREQPDVVFLQRAEKMPVRVVEGLGIPLYFWSTEPLIRRRDVDALLASGHLFEHIFLHTYTCLSVVEEAFPAIRDRCTVLHNAASQEILSLEKQARRKRLAVFNRNLSERRKLWLGALGDKVEIVEGQYGEAYFNTLQESSISLNIHYADSSVDDFETGIFEALACGAVVVSESLNPRTVRDMGIGDAVIQVDSPEHMARVVTALEADPGRISQLQQQGVRALAQNTWDQRASVLLEHFRSSQRSR